VWGEGEEADKGGIEKWGKGKMMECKERARKECIPVERGEREGEKIVPSRFSIYHFWSLSPFDLTQQISEEKGNALVLICPIKSKETTSTAHSITSTGSQENREKLN